MVYALPDGRIVRINKNLEAVALRKGGKPLVLQPIKIEYANNTGTGIGLSEVHKPARRGRRRKS